MVNSQIKIESLLDAFTAYVDYLQRELGHEKAKASINKLKTGLVRFTLPGWGYPLKLTGRLTPEEMLKGIEFMASISLLQANQALEVQDGVFQRLGTQVSDPSKRVYRSAVRQFIEYCQSLAIWPTYKQPGLPPTAYIYGKPRKVWRHFGLRSEDVPPALQSELDAYSQALTHRTPPLSPSSIDRELRGVRQLLGWLRLTQNLASEDLTLSRVVPIEALFEEAAAMAVLNLTQEYLNWLRAREESVNTLKQAFMHVLYLTEYAHYVHTNQDSPADAASLRPQACAAGSKAD